MIFDIGSIARALSRSAGHSELISVVERDSSENEVKSSWEKLFNHSPFNEAFDVVQKKKIKDINRQTTKNRIEDMVTQLSKIEKDNDLNFLVIPWDYTLLKLETDGEKLANIMVEENARDHEAKFDAFEKRMEKKHSDLCSSIQNMLKNLIPAQNAPAAPSFARVAGGGIVGGPRDDVHRVEGVQAQVVHRVRGRSPSVKRFRTDDTTGGVDSARVSTSQTQAKGKPKPVVGTSDSKVTGRKMRSPPADIFVWGVHPETTVEDFENDLAASDIIIRESDVVKKSNKEAYLCSYKISVPAADLTKALDPSIWPLRVKVREFIHYPRKYPRQQDPASHPDQGQARPVQQQGGHGYGGQQQGVHHLQVPDQGRDRAGGANHLQVPGLRLENMCAALAKHSAASL